MTRGTGETLCAVPVASADQVDAAVQHASEALRGDWSTYTAQDRANWLERIADRIEENLDAFAALESQDTGKPISLARRIDIPRAVANFRFFAGAIRHDFERCHAMANAINYTQRRPLGVVALITPWNLPLYLLSWKVAPALAMGNVVIAKPSELTPLTASALAEVIKDLGLPSGVFNLVHGDGATTGQSLVEHPDVKAVSFTGGTTTGRIVAATAAPQFKKLSLELGGKNPTVIFADCDLDQAVNGAARAAFTNQGEICLCGSRILVQSDIYEEFEQRFIARVEAIRVGAPEHPETECGALISNAHKEKVLGYIELAKSEGGTILCGGDAPEGTNPDGFFVRPTVVGGLPPSCRTANEEVFGPLVTLHSFDTEDEALSIANSTRYGLSASIWTQNLQRAHRFSANLDTGMVWVNTWLKRDLRVPFGGVKESGVGREGGRLSLEFYSESKNICVEVGS